MVWNTIVRKITLLFSWKVWSLKTEELKLTTYLETRMKHSCKNIPHKYIIKYAYFVSPLCLLSLLFFPLSNFPLLRYFLRLSYFPTSPSPLSDLYSLPSGLSDNEWDCMIHITYYRRRYGDLFWCLELVTSVFKPQLSHVLYIYKIDLPSILL